jgi:hypothetical protein
MTAAERAARIVVSADRDADAQDLALLLERLRAEVAEHEFDIVADPQWGRHRPGRRPATRPA